MRWAHPARGKTLIKNEPMPDPAPPPRVEAQLSFSKTKPGQWLVVIKAERIPAKAGLEILRLIVEHDAANAAPQGSDA